MGHRHPSTRRISESVESCLHTSFNVLCFHPWLKWSKSEQSPANLYLPSEYINSFLINDFIPGELMFRKCLPWAIITAAGSHCWWRGWGRAEGCAGGSRRRQEGVQIQRPFLPLPPSTEQPTCLVHLGYPWAPGDRTGLGKWHLHGVKREI